MNLGLAGAVIGVGALGGAVIRATDDFANYRSQINLVIKDGENFRDVQAELLDVANRTSTEIGTTVDLYTRLSRALQDAGVNLRGLSEIEFVETIQQAFVVSGATADEASRAAVQLSQAFAGGTLRAEEFNSILDAAPYLLQQMAAGLGVTTGELRKMVVAGTVGAQDMFDALAMVRDNIEKDSDSIADTSEKANTRLANSFSALAAAIGEASKIQQAYTGIASGIADILDRWRVAIDGTDTEKLVQLQEDIADTEAEIQKRSGSNLASDILRLKNAQARLVLLKEQLEEAQRLAKVEKDAADERERARGGTRDTEYVSPEDKAARETRNALEKEYGESVTKNTEEERKRAEAQKLADEARAAQQRLQQVQQVVINQGDRAAVEAELEKQMAAEAYYQAIADGVDPAKAATEAAQAEAKARREAAVAAKEIAGVGGTDVALERAELAFDQGNVQPLADISIERINKAREERKVRALTKEEEDEIVRILEEQYMWKVEQEGLDKAAAKTAKEKRDAEKAAAEALKEEQSILDEALGLAGKLTEKEKERADAVRDRLEALLMAGEIDQNDYNEAIRGLNERLGIETRSTLEIAVTEGLNAGFTSGNWKQSLATSLVALIASSFTEGSEQGLGGGRGGGVLGFLNFGGRRQRGGPVRADQAYLVGEDGPELLVPGQRGFVQPLQNGMGARNVNVSLNYTNNGVDYGVDAQEQLFNNAGFLRDILTQQLSELENDG